MVLDRAACMRGFVLSFLSSIRQLLNNFQVNSTPSAPTSLNSNECTHTLQPCDQTARSRSRSRSRCLFRRLALSARSHAQPIIKASVEERSDPP